MNRGFAGSGTYIEKGHRLAGRQVFPLYSGEMTASCATRTFPRCHESPFSSWSFVGILLVVQVLLLPTSSDACDDPPRFQSMKLKGASQATYNPGDKIEYECRPGYMRIVPLLTTTAVCQADNTWAPLQEACTRKPCPQLGDPLNGRVNGTFLFGSQAHFVCNEGFQLVGPEILHCDLAGNSVAWDNEPPYCEKILCKPPRQIPNGKYTNSHKDTFEYNEVVIYSCNPSSGPDEYSLVGESELICSGFDTWSSDPPECKVVKCPYPALENGKFVSGFGKKFYYRATVVLQCYSGYYLKGNDTIVCGADNMWEPKVPECIKESISPSTKLPTSSHSVSVPTSTQPTISSVSGVKPTTAPPVSRLPDHPSTSEPPSEVLGGWIIAVIVIFSLIFITLLCCGFAFLIRKKKREREGSASYSTYQNKSTTPEQTH
ncbi:CD46 molecule [Rhinolophus ferrumequinum]|uniref:Membrane cofactor protein n=1 Tax=Rhinolophus ferrumequinum TaxID=59479 RepID=A0A7J7SVY2_RHIFE|nr:CD46 molecule [Rhinolophus ferrumequinum]